MLKKAGELHGHFCLYVALGVRTGYTALKTLGIERNLGMEEVVAIMEANNCFSDGIQMTTGCSFANNALIYHDLGKTAVTVTKRDGGHPTVAQAVPIAVRADYSAGFAERYPEAHALFEKIVTNREEPTPEEQARLSQLWAEASYRQLSVPEEEIFTVEKKHIDLPAYAPIHDSAICSVCGESVMETRARVRDGEPVCLGCRSCRVIIGVRPQGIEAFAKRVKQEYGFEIDWEQLSIPGLCHECSHSSIEQPA